MECLKFLALCSVPARRVLVASSDKPLHGQRRPQRQCFSSSTTIMAKLLHDAPTYLCIWIVFGWRETVRKDRKAKWDNSKGNLVIAFHSTLTSQFYCEVSWKWIIYYTALQKFYCFQGRNSLIYTAFSKKINAIEASKVTGRAKRLNQCYFFLQLPLDGAGCSPVPSCTVDIQQIDHSISWRDH